MEDRPSSSSTHPPDSESGGRGGRNGGRRRGGRGYYQPPHHRAGRGDETGGHSVEDQHVKQLNRGNEGIVEDSQLTEKPQKLHGGHPFKGKEHAGRSPHPERKAKFQDRKHNHHEQSYSSDNAPPNAPAIFANSASLLFIPTSNDKATEPHLAIPSKSSTKEPAASPAPPAPPAAGATPNQTRSTAAVLNITNTTLAVHTTTPKKLRKLIFRKLPASKDYTMHEFSSQLQNLLQKLTLPEALFRIDHFSTGKLSRKRGPIFSTAYVTVLEEEFYEKFLRQVPSKVPFLEGDTNGQPDIGIAPYSKSFRMKEKQDKHVNTYEEDPVFLAFKQRIENPEDNHAKSEGGNSAASVVLGALAPHTASNPAPLTLEEKLKNNSLLNFLREKSQKKVFLKKIKKEKKLFLDKKEKVKEKKKKKREAKKALEFNDREDGGSEKGTSVDAANSSIAKKKRNRKKKERKGNVALGDPPLIDGNNNEITSSKETQLPVSPPKKKIVILKKEKPLVTESDVAPVAAPTTTDSTTRQPFEEGKPSEGQAPAKLSRREKSRLKREQFGVGEASHGESSLSNPNNDPVPPAIYGDDPHHSIDSSIPPQASRGGRSYDGPGGRGRGGRWKRNYY